MLHLPRCLRFFFAVSVMLAGMFLALPAAFAQNNTTEPAASNEKKPPAPAQSQAQAKPQVELPSAAVTLTMVRSTLMTFNDALATGNFTVLHDIASPSFQAANNPEKLRQIFANLAASGISLYPVAILAPQLQQNPYIDDKQLLHIAGVFPGNPVQINFELVFELVNNRWRLFGISVNPVKSEATETASTNPSGKKTAAPAPSKPASTSTPPSGKKAGTPTPPKPASTADKPQDE
jgi:hypothetical protein